MKPMDPMKDALLRRRGKGIDLTIMIGEPQAGDEDKKSDLAPPGESPEQDDESLVKTDQEGMDQEEAEGYPMLEPMDEMQKEDLMKRKPRSLGERAKQFAMMKK